MLPTRRPFLPAGLITRGAVGDRLRGSPHLQRVIERVHAAGARPVTELLIEAMEGTGADVADLERLLARWRRLDPDLVRRLGGRDFPRPRPRLVPEENDR